MQNETTEKLYEVVNEKCRFTSRDSTIVLRYLGKDKTKAHAALRNAEVRDFVVSLAAQNGMTMPGLNDHGIIRAIDMEGNPIPVNARYQGEFTYEITFRVLAGSR